MKKLPESFGIMRDASNPLWGKYIAWLMERNATYLEGSEDMYYGVGLGIWCLNETCDTVLTLEQWDSIVNSKTEQFKAMKFRVDSPEHSRQIQERLFEMGYKWTLSGGKIMYTYSYYLCTKKNGIIEHGTSETSYQVNSGTETTLSDISPWQPKQGETIEVSANGLYWDEAIFVATFKGRYVCLNGCDFEPYQYIRSHNPHREEIERLKARLKELEG